MKKKISLLLVILTVCALFTVFVMPANAVYDTSDGYVMLDLRSYDGKEIPFGKGKNGNCYYPIDGNNYNFPEVYTWGGATITVTDEGAKVTATKAGGAFLLEFDKAPSGISSAINFKTMKNLVVRLKANAAKEDASFNVVSLGNTYKKVYEVKLTGEWQTVVFDLSGKGWGKKDIAVKEVVDEKTGEKKTQNVQVYNDIDEAVWDDGKFGNAGFRVDFPALGDEITAEYVIDYLAFMEDPNEKFLTGPVNEHNAYIKGYAGNLFKPNATMTRAEACTIITRLIADENNLGELKTAFADVPENQWYFKYVAYLESKGYLKSYSGTFAPNQSITRAEFVELVYNMGLLKETDKKVTFSDVPENHPRYTVIMAAAAAGLVGGYNDGTFLPDRTITRAQVVKVINTALGRKSTADSFKKFELDGFNDVAADFWAYADIVEASVAHKARFDAEGNEVWSAVLEAADFEATKAKIAEVDVAAKKLREEIHNSADELVIFGDTYYVSNNGNDSADGKTTATAWKTLSRVNSASLKEGDAVLFERGGLWRGQIVTQQGVSYGAYGTGEKPRLYGSPENGAVAENWTLVEGTTNIWQYKNTMIDSGTVVFNDGEAHSIKEIPSYKDGKYIKRNSDVEFDFKKDITNDLGLFCDNKGNPNNNSTLYLRSDKGNPGELYTSIEFLPRRNGFNAKSNVTIDNFCIKYVGSHGVGAGTVTGLYVTNCEFEWIGGGIQHYNNGIVTRYGNAIEIYGGCDDYLVENNYINEVYDAGATHQLSAGGGNNCIQKNATYRNNLFEKCIYSIEYFLGKPDSDDTVRYQENIIMENNIMRYAGFGFGEQRPDIGSAAHIKGWDHYNKTTENFVIRNNIFDRSRHMLIHCGAGDESWLPKFENNVYIQYISDIKYSDKTSANPTLGRYSKNPTANLKFDLGVRQTMKMKGIEEKPELYFAERDYLWDLPIG